MEPGFKGQEDVAELDRIRAQDRLLGSVAWYLASLGASVILFVAGTPMQC